MQPTALRAAADPEPLCGQEPMMGAIRNQIENGPFPYSDGWGWLYHSFERIAPAGGLLRRAICGYFYPSVLERWRGGMVYKLLGVHLFGALIPTGGVVVRRVTKARMVPYTLAGSSLGAARAFYYRACVFEALHLPFFLTLVGLALHRAAIGRPDLALENTTINLLANLYPMLHHRRTRTRIGHLLNRRAPRLGMRKGGLAV